MFSGKSFEILHFIFSPFQYWNILALDGSNWQRVDLFDFQVDVKVCIAIVHIVKLLKHGT